MPRITCRDILVEGECEHVVHVCVRGCNGARSEKWAKNYNPKESPWPDGELSMFCFARRATKTSVESAVRLYRRNVTLLIKAGTE